MERHEDLEEEYLVLLFERQGEPVDDGAQDLQQLRHAVVPLSLVHEPVEDVVDLQTTVSLVTDLPAYSDTLGTREKCHCNRVSL